MVLQQFGREESGDEVPIQLPMLANIWALRQRPLRSAAIFPLVSVASRLGLLHCLQAR